MLFTTASQWAVLALLLVAGWFFGLASAPTGRRWRTRYEEERDAHAAYRRDADARARDHERRIADLDRLHAEQAAAVTSAANRDRVVVRDERVVTPTAPVTTTRETVTTTDPAARRPGWFAWNR